VGGLNGKIAVQMGYAAKESLAKRKFVKLIKKEKMSENKRR
jgi:hypothetical protein